MVSAPECFRNCESKVKCHHWSVLLVQMRVQEVYTGTAHTQVQRLVLQQVQQSAGCGHNNVRLQSEVSNTCGL